MLPPTTNPPALQNARAKCFIQNMHYSPGALFVDSLCLSRINIYPAYTHILTYTPTNKHTHLLYMLSRTYPLWHLFKHSSERRITTHRSRAHTLWSRPTRHMCKHIQQKSLDFSYFRLKRHVHIHQQWSRHNLHTQSTSPAAHIPCTRLKRNFDAPPPKTPAFRAFLLSINYYAYTPSFRMLVS